MKSRDNLMSDNPHIRYWGSIALHAQPEASVDAESTLRNALSDESAAVRIEAASALIHHGEASARATLITELEHDDLSTVLHAVRNLEMSISSPDDAPDGTVDALRTLLAHCEEIRPSDTPPTVVTAGDQDLAMFIMMSANALLKKLGQTCHEDSRKAEYAIRALLILASESPQRTMQIQEMSKRGDIPVKFLEQILLTLRKAGLLHSKRGVGGGYRLERPSPPFPWAWSSRSSTAT